MYLKSLVRRALVVLVACAPVVAAHPNPSAYPAVDYPVTFANAAGLLAATSPALLHAIEKVRSP